MSVTIDDVALRANLNKGSVSRILNGKGESYSSQTRQRVLDTAAELGYRPNLLARALGTGKTNTVAMWLLADEFYSPYFGFLNHCLQQLGVEHNYQMIIDAVPVVTGRNPNGSMLLNWPVDGIICSYMTRSSAEYLHKMVKEGTPIVYMQRAGLDNLIPYPNTDYVLIDVELGARQAVQHLLDAGCKRLAFVGESDTFERDPRGSVYSELVQSAGQEPEFIAVSEGHRTGGYETMKAYLQTSGQPDGLFCINDEVAIGCYLALQEAGLKVPDDILVVGFDGMENARLFPCPISSVVVPVEKMAALAWEMLVERINDPALPLRQRILPTQLEVRASSQR